MTMTRATIFNLLTLITPESLFAKRWVYFKVKNNINYKVQILAGHKIISQNYLSNKFKFKENYSIESHGGWLKYTVGDNTKYSEARDNRNELDKYNFPGPFVIAYNYDKRVTVQEALILTNQNWTP